MHTKRKVFNIWCISTFCPAFDTCTNRPTNLKPLQEQDGHFAAHHDEDDVFGHPSGDLLQDGLAANGFTNFGGGAFATTLASYAARW